MEHMEVSLVILEDKETLDHMEVSLATMANTLLLKRKTFLEAMVIIIRLIQLVMM